MCARLFLAAPHTHTHTYVSAAGCGALTTRPTFPFHIYSSHSPLLPGPAASERRCVTRPQYQRDGSREEMPADTYFTVRASGRREEALSHSFIRNYPYPWLSCPFMSWFKPTSQKVQCHKWTLEGLEEKYSSLRVLAYEPLFTIRLLSHFHISIA